MKAERLDIKNIKRWGIDLDGVLCKPIEEDCSNWTQEQFNLSAETREVIKENAHNLRCPSQDIEWIIITGRPESDRKSTEKWLNDSGFKDKYKALYMVGSDKNGNIILEDKVIADRKLNVIMDEKITRYFDDNEFICNYINAFSKKCKAIHENTYKNLKDKGMYNEEDSK